METLNEGKPRASTAGALLKQARQQRGLHIAALAVTLKVPQAKLEAVEADRWGDLPDATFARALATAMARALKVEAAEVLALMPTGERSLNVSPGLNQPFRDRAAPSDDSMAWATRPVVWAPALILLAAAALYWFPSNWLPERAAPEPAASAPFAAASVPLEFVAAPAAPTALPPTTPVAAASGAVVAQASPVASAPVQALPASAPVVLNVTAAALRLKASASSWVEVVDGRGQVLLSKTLRAGDEQDVDGKPPLKLRIGNAPATRVQWRGTDVDLQAHAKGEVARLELN